MAPMHRALTILLALRTSATESSDTVVLTDANFEHDTQASTGMTTGDWFIMFHASWCGHCKVAMPEIEKFATSRRGQMNVGKVEVPQSSGLRERFRIQGFPTFYFLSKGMMYKYDGPRNEKGFENFVTEEYKKKTGAVIPPELNIFNRFAFYLEDDFEEIFKRRQFAVAVIAIVCFFLGIFLTLILQCILCASADRSKKDKKGSPAPAKRQASTKKD